ncbi:MAG: hypothetical protein JJU06_14255 [Ectothiorhodospiraceae bacterium]|nr:hypothetical protein [Ectothiorhodospiraceae bacterium]MCH8505810.1 hypothetical protein [Ectothiorhodospiraceae bacterium]
MDHSTLSFEIRMIIARMARLVRKFDGIRTGLSDEGDILGLLRVAEVHERPEVRSIYDEMLYVMSREELRYMVDHGLDLPEEYAARLAPPPVSMPPGEGARPKMMYRGQVVRR